MSEGLVRVPVYRYGPTKRQRGFGQGWIGRAMVSPYVVQGMMVSMVTSG